MAFTTSGQETEWALFLQPRSPHGVWIVYNDEVFQLRIHCKVGAVGSVNNQFRVEKKQ